MRIFLIFILVCIINNVYALGASTFLGRIVRVDLADTTFNGVPGVLIHAVGITDPTTTKIAANYAVHIYSPIGTLVLTNDVNMIFIASLNVTEMVTKSSASLQNPISAGEDNIIVPSVTFGYT